MFWFFGHVACGILAADQGSNPHPLLWEANPAAKSQPLDRQGRP